ncbi:hypothetical protein DERP_006000 [Dermatophagoides pteronyssinus]|uniref:Uncharacterized protein n=1 Tax=Dermatophagoides pteronyssinus TaxID=6956 RepID=A0ABQ8JS06_DERPT|nr:hypothetical protein DERP_006000 [Dermatophagoides pteronyssinus]
MFMLISGSAVVKRAPHISIQAKETYPDYLAKVYRFLSLMFRRVFYISPFFGGGGGGGDHGDDVLSYMFSYYFGEEILFWPTLFE